VREDDGEVRGEKRFIYSKNLKSITCFEED
jgi:hypothetical protein